MRDCMTRAPHSIGKTQRLEVAHKLMRENGLRHLPVLEGGKIVGILSQRDLYFLETIAGVKPETEQVEDAMSPEVYVVTPDARASQVAAQMAKHKYGCAVVAENGHVVGVFTTTDALGLLAALLKAA